MDTPERELKSFPVNTKYTQPHTPPLEYKDGWEDGVAVPDEITIPGFEITGQSDD